MNKKYVFAILMLIAVFVVAAVSVATLLKTRVLWSRSWMNLKIWMD